MKPILSLKDCEFRQGGFTLAIPRLDLLPGQLYALAGPNGAGKSTLLRLLALLEKPHRGELFFAGEPVRSRTGRWLLRRQITLVHQSPYLFTGTVHYNLAYGLRLRGVRGSEQNRRIDEALAAVGLAGAQQRQVRELSGGEAQRVALARALALRPQVLLLDEPTTGLDQDRLATFEHWLIAYAAQGVTVVLTTHEHGQQRRLGAQALRLKDGRLQPALVPINVPRPDLKEYSPWPSPLKKQEA